MARRGFTWTELVVVLLIFGVLAALLLPALSPARRGHERTCGSNLSQLTKAMYNYSITKSPVEGGFPSGAGFTGGAFWTTLYSTKEIDDPKILVCPVLGTTVANGTNTDYRGPRTNPNVVPADSFLGGDRIGNHGSDPSAPLNGVGKIHDGPLTPGDVELWAQYLRDTSD